MSLFKREKRKYTKRNQPEPVDELPEPTSEPLSPETKRILWGVSLTIISILMGLSVWGHGGAVGSYVYINVLKKLLGYGSMVAPVLMLVAGLLVTSNKKFLRGWVEILAFTMMSLGILGLLHFALPLELGGGVIGKIIGGSLIYGFDTVGAFFILSGMFLLSVITLFSSEINWSALRETWSSMLERSHNEPDEDYYDDSTPEVETTTIDLKSLVDDEPEPEKPSYEPVPTAPIKPEPEIAESSFSIDDYDNDYEFPPLSLLSKSSGKSSVGDIKTQANLIKRTLQNFGIDVEMDEVSVGPTVTRYSLKPAEGIKLSRIIALKHDLALALAAHPIRIEAPIPGKSLVGIELPNTTKSSVGLGSLLSDKEFESSPKPLLVALGKGVTGKSYFADIAKMPHLLIAGTTGSGKSVTVHNLILSLLYRKGPKDLRFIMVDPKRVELTLYNNIPHLLTPVIKEPKKAIMALRWAAKEMERRYDVLESHSCRDIGSYHTNILAKWQNDHDENDRSEAGPERMPYIVIIIDELADIMQAYPRELEAGIVRLAQMSRAVGIHLILSTQRPSVNVITGLIKANIPSRLALQVASQIDSRTILDAPGAESLLGKGDTLFQGSDMSKPERMQCGNVSEEEVKNVVRYIVKHNDMLPDDITIGEGMDEHAATTSGSSFGDIPSDSDDDELYGEALRAVREAGKASTSYLQRKLKVGYSRAARLIDLLEERGIVGAADGSKPREVIDNNHTPQSSISEVADTDDDAIL